MQSRDRIVAAAAARLARARDYPRVLLTYEGALADRLAFRLAVRVLTAFDVLCSVRPCMDRALQAEVRAFAAAHGYPLADRGPPCRVDAGGFVSAACGNVAEPIGRYFGGERGLLIVPAPVGRESRRGFAEANARTRTFDAVAADPAFVRGARGAWVTLLLFEGFAAAELAAASEPRERRQHRVPVCWFDCYHDDQQRELRRALITESCGAPAPRRSGRSD